jgi:hypothetical protein
MSDLDETARAQEVRIADLERQVAALRPRERRPLRASGSLIAVVAVAVALLLPGFALASHQFPDVPASNPFHEDIDWLADYGITTGFGDGTYKPAQAVTRQAMAAFLHRLSNQVEVVSTSIDPSANTVFQHTTFCPTGKRAIGGGGSPGGTSNIFVTDSYPGTDSWYVRWETDNDASLNPTSLIVWAVCVPRL